MFLTKVYQFYRIKDWPHLLGLIILGLAAAREPLPPQTFIFLMAVGCSYLAHGYSINDIYDDQIKGLLSRNSALLLSYFSLLICLILCLFHSIQYFSIALFGHLAGWFYSAKPFRFKNKLWLDLIFNSLALTPLFLLGYLLNRQLSHDALYLAIYIFIYFIPVQLLHEINDDQIDIQFHQNNSFQILGIRKTMIVSIATLLLLFIYSIILLKIGLMNLIACSVTGLFVAFIIFYLALRIPLTGTAPSTPLPGLKHDVRLASIVFGIILLMSFFKN